MKLVLSYFFVFFLSAKVFSQVIIGNWQGFLIPQGKKIEQASLIYLSIPSLVDTEIRSREEFVGKDGFMIKKWKGKFIDSISFEGQQTFIEKRKEVFGFKWCNMTVKLKYNDSTGYLEGSYISNDCRGYLGKIVCYKSPNKLNSEPTDLSLQSWRPIFLEDIKLGRKSTEKREYDRKNFVFHPVLFDYDKDEVKPEYYAYLKSMVELVKGHTDLRIKVIGHTDSDGVAVYNDDLSRRRADNIIKVFLSYGLAKDRVVLEFQGENSPIDSNKTPEGKQKNRRVDFLFI